MGFLQLNSFFSATHAGVDNLALFLLACLAICCVSYLVLTIFTSSRLSGNPMTTVYQYTCAIELALGLWSACIAMILSFRPGIEASYDLEWVIISLLVALLGCYAAFSLLRKPITFVYGATLLGVTIAILPYISLCATTGLAVSYAPIVIAFSVLFAVGMAIATLWTAMKSTQQIIKAIRYKIIGALILSFAICITYFMSIWATEFIASSDTQASLLVDGMSLLWLSALAFVLMFVIALMFYTNQELTNEQLIVNARLSGMTEMATKMLHNAETKINEVNVSAVSIMQRLERSKLFELHEIGQWMMDHQKDLNQVIHDDPQGVQIPNRVISIGEEWRDEQTKIYNELKGLLRNTQFIKDIISTQQSLQYEKAFEQNVSLNTLIEEAILLTGVNLAKNGIMITKDCTALPPILIDKVKLLQILVNIFRNAKESLAETNRIDKKIAIKLKNENQTIFISITDNGMGIAPENIAHIFDHGFTTKKQGHGYGLHSSALLTRQLNGMLKASSAGAGRGAVFMLSLPYKNN